MTINASDVVLLESERMTDTQDGGGRATNNVIPDGVAGSLFPKISRLDSVHGRVNLRKIYGRVRTANTDTYAGAHAILTDPADNAQISTVAFTTESDFDTRTEARDFIESYVVAGPESRMRLYGRQPAGAKALLVYQRQEEPLPDIGDVYALHQENDQGSILREQFVRIDSVSGEISNFEDDKGVYTYRLVTLGTTSKLEMEFAGPDTPQRDSSAERLGKIRVTTVADAARYFGVQPLEVAAHVGDLDVKLPSIYAPLVPTTQREIPISLANVFESTSRITSGVTFGGSTNGFSTGNTYRFPSGVLPGSVSFTNANPGYPITDDGAGLMFSAGATTPLGSIDYDTGLVTLSTAPGAAGGIGTNATHAAKSTFAAVTKAISITPANRGAVFSEVLSPAPGRGTLVLDYRALGKWYRLRDETSQGTLAGASAAEGTGTIDYNTGAVVITLGALPDVDSSVIFSWGGTGDFVNTTTDHDARVRQQLQLTKSPVVASSCTVTGTFNGAVQTATLNSGGAGTSTNFTAALNAATGLLEITYTGMLPDAGTNISAQYNAIEPGSGQPPLQQSVVRLLAGTVQLGQGVVPKSLTFPIRFVGNTVVDGVTFGIGQLARDDGAGNIVVGRVPAYLVGAPSAFSFASVNTVTDTIIGTVNYSTGELQFSSSPVLVGSYATYNRVTGYTQHAVNMATTRTDVPTTFSFNGTGGTTSATVTTDTFSRTAAPFLVDLTKTVTDSVLPGSVLFRIGDSSSGVANQYSDRDGSLYMGTGEGQPGTPAGTIEYTTGIARVHTVLSNTLQGSVSVQACLTGISGYVADTIDFRTSGSPVRLGSLFIQATAADGTQLSGTSDISGTITGDIAGTVLQDVGVVSVTFSQKVLPSSVRYSAVVTSNISLDPDILGLDPVRLPIDGRVPIYRPGDIGVLHNTQDFALPNPATAGSTYSVGRTALSDLWLVTADNALVDPAKYTVNLTAGTVTMADPLSLTGLAQPLKARHRIEQMVPITDAQIDGTVSIGAALGRDFPTTGTYFSSALLHGDKVARVFSVFDQGTWTGVWSDQRIGDGANAEYNTVLFPLEVLNTGAITERWRIQFTNSTAFQCFGEQSGLVGTGTTGADFAPVNPLTSQPYFTIRTGGWGGGWSVGNNLRFNSEAAGAPMWLARTVLPGATLAGDSISLEWRGDVDA
jgi:hypothetical protein